MPHHAPLAHDFAKFQSDLLLLANKEPILCISKKTAPWIGAILALLGLIMVGLVGQPHPPPTPSRPRVNLQNLFAYPNTRQIHIITNNSVMYNAEFETQDSAPTVLRVYYDRLTAGVWKNVVLGSDIVLAEYYNPNTGELYAVHIIAQPAPDGLTNVQIDQKAFAEP
jgi:hypothetical protein